ncbi:ParA family protein [Fusobacterium periodonticum]|uniref:ParA family protein n=1 Tax=Fusobacterium periodonticum TaxID=860 RepID=UPI0028D13B85|nr:ParA family protein [Fusobacterium periodonticum]
MGIMIQVKVQKGGLGKSFITANLAHLLSLLDKKTLIISTDTQNSIFQFFFKKINKDFKEGLIKAIKTKDIDSYTIKDIRKNLDFIPIENINFSKQLVKKVPEFLDLIRKKYEYIVIDSTPSLELDKVFLENVDKIIIPATGDRLAIDGIVNIVKVNREKVSAIVFNKFTNNKINQLYYTEVSKLAKEFNIFISEPIPSSVHIAALVERGKTIWETRLKKKFISITQEIFKELVKILF